MPFQGTLDKVTYEHWMIETKEALSKNPQLLPFINPNTMVFYKLKNIYLTMNFEGDRCVVLCALKTYNSDFNWIACLEDVLRRNNFKTVEFHTSEKNLVVINTAKNMGAKQISIMEGFYPDGSNCLVFSYDISDDLNSTKIKV